MFKLGELAREFLNLGQENSLLLTRKERLQVWADYYSCKAVNITKCKVEFDEYLCRAQLAKAYLIIEKRERERLLEYLKSLLKTTPRASLAATIDLIEATDPNNYDKRGK